MSLVESVKQAKERVGEAFDTLIADIEADESVATPDPTSEPVKVVKLTAEYSDGSTVDFTPPGGDADAVKDLTEDAPAEAIENGNGEGEGKPKSFAEAAAEEQAAQTQTQEG